MGQYDNETVAQWRNGTMGQRDNGSMDNGTMGQWTVEQTGNTTSVNMLPVRMAGCAMPDFVDAQLLDPTGQPAGCVPSCTWPECRPGLLVG